LNLFLQNKIVPLRFLNSKEMTRILKLILCVSALLLVSCEEYEPEAPIDLTEVFIAHAGGRINGYIYTNSLEVLNLSYSMGCKLFELDICETSDSVFVAAHDWTHFKRISGYQGAKNDDPLSEQEFLSLQIHGAFTPMNMTAINAWFAEHEDAILVTDKINEPKRFAEQFHFKNRLIMELFSWNAVEDALKIGIKAMPSENLVIWTPNSEQIMDSLNIKYIAVSRRVLEGRKQFFKKLKNNGIKTYVYHVNFDIEKNEKYVFENEMHLITGMYADDLSILNSHKFKTW
jgi:glycerophosphoryl diester phosphodiesterase